MSVHYYVCKLGEQELKVIVGYFSSVRKFFMTIKRRGARASWPYDYLSIVDRNDTAVDLEYYKRLLAEKGICVPSSIFSATQEDALHGRDGDVVEHFADGTTKVVSAAPSERKEAPEERTPKRKSLISTIRHRCMICCADGATDAQIIDLAARSSGTGEVVAWGLCSECKRFADEGLLALVECDYERSESPSDGAPAGFAKLYRTGRVVRIERDDFCALVKPSIASTTPCVFVDPAMMAKVEALRRRKLQ